jgi:hypothetical protein
MNRFHNGAGGCGDEKDRQERGRSLSVRHFSLLSWGARRNKALVTQPHAGLRIQLVWEEVNKRLLNARSGLKRGGGVGRMLARSPTRGRSPSLRDADRLEDVMLLPARWAGEAAASDVREMI